MREPKRKYRSKLRLTREVVESLINVPNGINVYHIDYEPQREIMSVYFTSEELVQGVYEVGEGQEIPHFEAFEEWQRSRVKELVKQMDFTQEELAEMFMREDE